MISSDTQDPILPRRTLSGRAFAVLTDQAVSSLTSFVILISALHALPPADLGVFTIAYATALLAISAVRGLNGEPLLVRFTVAKDSARIAASSAAAGASLCIGIVLCGIALCGAMMFGGPYGASMVLLAGVVATYVVQDTWRLHFISADRQWRAVLNSGICFVVTVAGLGVAAQAGWNGVPMLLGTWGLGGLAGAFVGMAQIHCRPRIFEGWGWMKDNRRMGPQLALERSSEAIGSQLSLVLIGTLASLDAVGQIGAARTIMAPVTTVTASLALFAVPEAVRLRAAGAGGLSTFVGVVSGVIVVTVVAFCALMLIIPSGTGEVIAGENWSRGKAILIPVAIWTAASGSRQGPFAALKAMGRSGLILRLALATVPVLLLATAIGAARGGAAGAAWSFAVVYVIGLSVTFVVYRHSQPAERNLSVERW